MSIGGADTAYYKFFHEVSSPVGTVSYCTLEFHLCQSFQKKNGDPEKTMLKICVELSIRNIGTWVECISGCCRSQ